MTEADRGEPQVPSHEFDLGQEIFPYRNARRIVPPAFKRLELLTEIIPIEIEKILNDHSNFEARRVLRLPTHFGLKKLPIEFGTTNQADLSLHITPFTPTEGYQITLDDKDLKKRRAALNRQIRNRKRMQQVKSTLGLSIEIESEELEDIGVVEFNDDKIKTIEAFEEVSSLVCQLRVGDMIYLSRGLFPLDTDLGALTYTNFFPADVGLLAAEASTTDPGFTPIAIGEGHGIAVPPNRLSDVGFTFFIHPGLRADQSPFI